MKKWLSVSVSLAMLCSLYSGVLVNNNQNDYSLVTYAEETSNVSVTSTTMYNDYLKLIFKNGRFSLRTTKGNPLSGTDDEKKLLYGYFSSGGGTSYTTINVDGKSYKYVGNVQDGGGFNAVEKNHVSYNVCGDIYVKQILSFVNNVSTNREDVIEIKYEVTNNGTENHDIGTRIMLDTMLAENDDAPFRVPGFGAITTETEFVGGDIPEYWQAFDSLTEPRVISQGSFLRDNKNRPDKVQFTNWEHVYDNSWNYSVNDSSNGDSAVSVIWNEQTFAPGETRTYTTYYGLSELTQDLLPPLAISTYGDTSVEIPKNGKADFTFTAYMENIGDGEAENAYIKIALPDGINLIGDNGVESYESMPLDTVKQVDWKLQIDSSFAEGIYPVTVTCGADEIEEKNVVRYITFVKSDIDDNRILWGEEKVSIFGNPKGEWTGEDNLSFINSKNNFTTYEWDPFEEFLIFPKKIEQDYYHVSETYFNTLVRGMSQNVVDYITEQRQSKWSGSCYGMSTVVSLMKAGYRSKDAKVAHDLPTPKDSDTIENLINFYHLSQYLPDTRDVIDNSAAINDSDSSVVEQLIDEAKKVKKGGLPVVTCFFWKYEDSKGDVHNAGHAVVAYDVDDGLYTAADGNTYRYRVSICDPNKEKWTYLYVEDGYTSWYYEEMSRVSGGADKIVKGVDGKEIKFLATVLSTPEVIDIRNPEKGDDRTTLKDYNNLFISKYTDDDIDVSSGGKTAHINGWMCDGDLNVHTSAVMSIPAEGYDEDESSDNTIIVIPDTGDIYTVKPSDEGGELDCSITYPKYRMKVTTDSAKTASFNPDGEVILEGNNSDYEIKLSFNDGVGDLPWFSVTSYGENANYTSLKEAEKGMILTSDNLTDNLVTAYNIEEMVYVLFSTDEPSVNIRAVDDKTLGVYVDSDDDGTYDLLIADSKSSMNTDGEDVPPASTTETTTQTTTETTTTTVEKVKSSSNTGSETPKGLFAGLISAAACIFVSKKKKNDSEDKD